jgi:hypothetical protein
MRVEIENMDKNTLVKSERLSGRFSYEIISGTRYLGKLRYFKCHGQWVIIRANGVSVRYENLAEAKAAALNL